MATRRPARPVARRCGSLSSTAACPMPSRTAATTCPGRCGRPGYYTTRPAEIAAVHRALLPGRRAGGHDCQLSGQRRGLRRSRTGPVEAEELIKRSVTIAREVRDGMAEDGTPRWVAASVGPYGAALADGSEYRGRYGLSRAELRDFHLPRLELLASAGPDLLAIETIPDVEEAEVLARTPGRSRRAGVVLVLGAGLADQGRSAAGRGVLRRRVRGLRVRGRRELLRSV